MQQDPRIEFFDQQARGKGGDQGKRKHEGHQTAQPAPVDTIRPLAELHHRPHHMAESFGGMGEENGKFYLPNGLFVDEDDNVFITDTLNLRVSVFN